MIGQLLIREYCNLIWAVQIINLVYGGETVNVCYLYKGLA